MIKGYSVWIIVFDELTGQSFSCEDRCDKHRYSDLIYFCFCSIITVIAYLSGSVTFTFHYDKQFSRGALRQDTLTLLGFIVALTPENNHQKKSCALEDVLQIRKDLIVA